MPLRPAATVLAIVLTAAACAGGADTELADGSRTVEEATSPAQVHGTEDASTEVEAATDDHDGTVTDDADAEGSESEAVQPLWWTAPTVADGSPFVAGDLAGENVVLWMWAPWCSVCNREAPEVADALGDLPDDVTVIGVAGRDDVGPMRDFVTEHDLGAMTHVVDADGSIWSSYGISYQPAWVFIDADGNASVAAGELGRDGLFEGIEQVFGS